MTLAAALLVGGCNKSTPSLESTPTSVSATAIDAEQPPSPSIQELPNEGQLVKELLGVDAHVYEFSGTLFVVWLEAETKSEGEESSIRQLGQVSVTRALIENDSPQSIRGKFIVMGLWTENPKLRLLFESESKGVEFTTELQRTLPFNPAADLHGRHYQWKCPLELPEEGKEFVIATFHKSASLSQPTEQEPFETRVVQETTIRIKAKRLHGAPEPASSEQVAVTALRLARASVYLDGFIPGSFHEGEPLARAKKVSFPYLRQKMTAETLHHLTQLAELECLDLGYTQITNDELVHLRGLSKLQELRLGRSITADGLKHLTQLEKLRKLRIGPPGDSAASSVEPSSQAVLDARLKHLNGLTNMELLSLQGPAWALNDAAAEYINKLTNLRELYLDHADLSEVGLERLGDLSNLETLHLQGTKVTDAGLQKLHRLANLKQLVIGGGRCTDVGIQRFKASLPNCEVTL